MKTHWKALHNSDYIGSYTLMQSGQPEDMTVKIISVAMQPVTGQDGKIDQCIVAQLEGQKPFIINATNAKTISKMYASPFIEDWIGKSITLFVSKVKVSGEMIDALRVRPVVPFNASAVDTLNARLKLGNCKTLKELQAAYLALTKVEQSAPEIVKLKDELKKKLK